MKCGSDESLLSPLPESHGLAVWRRLESQIISTRLTQLLLSPQPPAATSVYLRPMPTAPLAHLTAPCPTPNCSTRNSRPKPAEDKAGINPPPHTEWFTPPYMTLTMKFILSSANTAPSMQHLPWLRKNGRKQPSLVNVKLPICDLTMQNPSTQGAASLITCIFITYS